MPVNLTGRKVLVMGIGKFGGGLDAVEYASRFAESVIAADISPAGKIDNIESISSLCNVRVACGPHNEDDFCNCDVLIVNPAVSPENRFIQIAKDSGAVVTSSIALFFEKCPAKIVAITGSNGKSTTTALTHHILSYASANSASSFRKAWLGGNIGNLPLLTLLDEISDKDLVVLEISSFQAEQLDIYKLAPDVAAITNLTPNHLDRHGTFEKYCDAKKTLFLNQAQGTYAFLNGEDPVSSAWDRELPHHLIVDKFNSQEVPKLIYDQYPLPGKANKSNLAAAIKICKALGVEEKTIASSVGSFKALPHRLELVAQSGGVKWYNDSISTTPESTIAGINAFDGGIVLIAGGYDKKIPFDDMCRLASERVKAAVLIGTTAAVIGELIDSNDNQCKVFYAGSLQEAVDSASDIAVNGDSILLSPACASYDMFDNFKQRGDMFSEMARRKCDD